MKGIQCIGFTSKKSNFFSILFLLLVLCTSFSASAQKWTVEVTGSILYKDKNLLGAKATVYADSNLVMAVTSVNGTFDFFLEPDNDYTLSFSKPGYIPTYLLFSTKNVPEKRAKQGFSPYNIIVLLSPKVKGDAAEQAVSAPQAVVKYDPDFEDGDFTYDKSYAKNIKPFLKVVTHEVKVAAEEQKNDALKSENKEVTIIVASYSGAILLLIGVFAVFITRSRRERQKLLAELSRKHQDNIG